jgi:predicted DNA-binding transcriptional regulator YafY
MSAVTPDVIRMLTLVPWLLARPGISVEATAQAFATTPEVIHRELDHLAYCGLPGLGGGDLIEVAIVDDAIVVGMADELRRPMRTTPAETMRLLLAASLAAPLLGEASEALARAIARLRASLRVPEGAVAVVEPEPDDLVDGLRSAIASGHRVRLRYRGRTETVAADRDLDPWRLDLVDGAWYLHAHDHGAGAARIFRLDRADRLRVEGGAVTVAAPAVLDPPRYVPAPDDPAVDLALTGRGTWLLDAVTPEAGGTLDASGARTVRVRVGAVEWFARLVLMAAGDAAVTTDGSVRDRIAELARSGLSRLAATPPDTEAPSAPSGGSRRE